MVKYVGCVKCKEYGEVYYMRPEQILEYCLEHFEGTIMAESWGEKGVFYNPGYRLKRGVYVLTVKEKDGENDTGSNLNRAGIYRVNFGLRKDTFKVLFGALPVRPAAGGIVDMNYDFTALDRLLPHPVYGWMWWVSILNPSEQSFEQIKPLIQESYEYSMTKFQKRRGVPN